VAKAYVKFWVKANKERDVQDQLLTFDEVQTADITAGEQDIISLVEASSFEALLDLVMNKLRAIEGVEKTVTDIIFEDRSPRKK
jgi:DNA-binding Lrp family transcriptional regulator